MAEAVVTGFQGEDYTKKDSIAACAKHYIGYGAVEGGRDYGHAEISDYTLRNYYLKPFKAAVKSGVATVMNSFNVLSGMPSAASRYLLYEVLKKELGFDGFVISDWATINRLIAQGVAENEKHAAELAINAGMDMDMTSECYIHYLEELVQEGKVSIKTIDESVLRILCVKLSFGLFENPYITSVKLDFAEHEKKAELCSDEGMVLLKNKNNILPLQAENTTVYAAGPMLHEKTALLGSWTLDGDLSRVTTIAEALKKKSSKVKMPASPYLWDECLVNVRRSDVAVLLLGESQKMTGEANSLSNIELPSEQLELVKKIHKLGKPIIGVMCFGRPIALGEAEEYFDAILYAWHCGTRTAQSVASILYGEVNPSGKLPMSIPRCTGQIPIYYNYSSGMFHVKSYYGDYDMEGHSYHDSYATPMYPFGYGLSYTEFTYSDISCAQNSMTLSELESGRKFELYINVKNTGSYDGKEVSQCYIHDVCASMTRPLRELKGFSKNLLKAGEEKKLCFELGYEELAFYNANAEFKAEKGDFEVYIGSDCYADKKVIITVE